MFTPSCSNTSALPHWLDTDRLPCLATFTPHAATTRAAAEEILNVPDRSPPVPQVSNTSSTGADSFTACSRIVRAKPTISAGRSPFITRAASSAASERSRRAPFHHLAHDAGSLVRREVLVAQNLLQQLDEHQKSRKFRRIRLPSSVSTDSG